MTAIPFILPLVLGRLINMEDYSIGSNIFDDLTYNEVTYDNKSVDAFYFITKNLSQWIIDDVDSPLDIALRIKIGDLSTPAGQTGFDGLLNDMKTFNNSVYMGVAVRYLHAYREIPSNSKPFLDWKSLVIEGGANAYVSSISYGGWFLVFNRVICEVEDDVGPLEEAVINIAGSKGVVDRNSFPSIADQVSKKIASIDLHGNTNAEFRIYSSTPIPVPLETPSDILKAIDEFPNIVTSDGKIGEPVLANLESINQLDTSFPHHEFHPSTLEFLKRIFVVYDDPVSAERSLKNWMMYVQGMDDFELSDEEELRIHELLTNLATVNIAIENAIYGLSLYRSPPETLVKEALALYDQLLPDECHTYRAAYSKLREDIGATCTNSMEYTAKGLLHMDIDYRANAKDTNNLEECEDLCLEDDTCRSISFAEKLSVLNEDTDNWEIKHNICWLFSRSTQTASLTKLRDIVGDIHTYNRNCGVYF